MVRVISPFVLAVALAGVAAPAQAQDFFRNFIAPRPIAPQPQQKAAPARVAPEQKQVKIIETPPAYEGEMARLAEILGALHYLRALCGANEGQKWRDQMQALLEAEAPAGERRSRMVANFNRGYRGFRQTYRTCTPAAGLAVRRYLEEGAKISREITARYAN